MGLVAVTLAIAAIQAPPADLAGRWEGALALPGGGGLKIVIRAQVEGDTLRTAMDSPDQNAFDLPVTDFAQTGGVVRFAIPAARGRFEGRRAADGQTITGVWSQGGSGLPLILTRTATTARVKPVAAPMRPQTPVAPFPYRAEQVAYDNPAAPGIHLAGTLTLPQGDGPFAAVVLITGSGTEDRDETVFGHKPFWVLADALSRRGVAVLRVDDRGAGDSTGDPRTATSQDFVGDVLAGVRFLQARPDIDRAHIGLIGHSEGGTIAPLVAEAGPGIAFVVMIGGPAVPGGDLITEQVRRIALASGASPDAVEAGAKVQAALMATVVDHADDGPATARAVEAQLIAAGQPPAQARASAAQVASPWFRWFVSHDPAPALAALKVPMLAIYGGKDLQVPADQNATALRRIAPSADVEVVPGVNHLMQTAGTGLPSEYATISETIAPSVLTLIVNWVTKQAGLATR